MSIELEVPNKKQLELAAKLGACAVGAIVVIKLVNKVRTTIKSKKQEKELKALRAQVAEQDQRISRLENGK